MFTCRQAVIFGMVKNVIVQVSGKRSGASTYIYAVWACVSKHCPHTHECVRFDRPCLVPVNTISETSEQLGAKLADILHRHVIVSPTLISN